MHPRKIRIVKKLSAIVESETLCRDHLRSRREPPPRVHTNPGVHITTTDITIMTTSCLYSKAMLVRPQENMHAICKVESVSVISL